MKQHSHSITLIVHAINYARYGYVPYQVYTGIKYTRAAGAFPPSLAISIVEGFPRIGKSNNICVVCCAIIAYSM